MKKRLQTILTGILALVLLISVGVLVCRGGQLRKNAQALEEAQRLIELPEPDVPLALPELPTETPPAVPEPTPEPVQDPEPVILPEPAFTDAQAEKLLGVDLTELQAENEDIIGWIEIPGTPVSYPLLQGSDNEYYLNHNWKKAYNSGGSIFMETQNRSDFSNFNTLIYGHRMSDSSMFNSLRHYADQTYLEQHPRIYIVTELGVKVYEVFAAMKVGITDPVYWLITDQQAYMQKMIDFCLENSVLEGAFVPTVEDRFLTLSTCTGLDASDDRWVVVAAEIGTVGKVSE